MTYPIALATKDHLDSGSDSPAMARGELAAAVDKINEIINALDWCDARQFAGGLAEALASSATAGKMIRVSDAQSCDDLTRPADRQIKIEYGGSINPAVGKTFNWNNARPIAGFYPVFGGAGAQSGLSAATPSWWFSNGLSSAVSAVISGGEIFFLQPYTETVASSITVSKNLTISSPNKEGVTITGPSNAPLFLGSGTVTQFILKGLTLKGGSGTSQILKVPDNPTVNWGEARVTVENNNINNCGDFALDFGQSQYMHDVRKNRFYQNVGSINEGWAADSVIEDNYFIKSYGSNPVIRTVGGSHTVIENNGFVRGTGGTLTAADIELNPTTSYGRGGHVNIHKNKFGPEGEIASRPKIRVYNATTSYRSTDVKISENTFQGAPSSAGGSTVAIQLDNPIYSWDVSHNHFDDFNTIINDAFAISATTSGNGVFVRNTINNQTRTPYILFANGGRGFSFVDSPQSGDSWGGVLSYEPIEARNRVYYSESLTNWGYAAGVTVTGGQADPYGGTSAWLLDRNGASAPQGVSRAIDITGMKSHVYLRFWAKAGTITTLIASLYDQVTGTNPGPLYQIALDNEWKEYTVAFRGLNAANAHTVYFYIGSTGSVAGNVYIYQPQVSDYPSDYIPTTGAAGVVNTAIGKRFSRPAQFASGLFATLSTYADNAAAVAGGLTPGRLYRTATGQVMVVY